MSVVCVYQEDVDITIDLRTEDFNEAPATPTSAPVLFTYAPAGSKFNEEIKERVSIQTEITALNRFTWVIIITNLSSVDPVEPQCRWGEGENGKILFTF